MTSTRQLCDAMGAALQVPGVEKWAAKLVRDGHLPRGADEVNGAEAVGLLLAVLGASHPEQASQTVERLASLSRLQVSKQFGNLESWMPVPDAEVSHFGLTPLDLVLDILECLVTDVSGVRAGLIVVARDAAEVVVYLHSAGEFWRVVYGDSVVFPAGLRISASISEPEIQALANSLKSSSPDAPSHAVEHAMPSLAIN